MKLSFKKFANSTLSLPNIPSLLTRSVNSFVNPSITFFLKFLSVTAGKLVPNTFLTAPTTLFTIASSRFNSVFNFVLL